jgi:hypothetical protein
MEEWVTEVLSKRETEGLGVGEMKGMVIEKLFEMEAREKEKKAVEEGKGK